MNAATLGVGIVGIAALVSACKESDDESTYTVEQLKNPATCKECHPKHYEEWSGSMHAYASFDPIFRAMNQRGQEETHGDLGDNCVKCHAPMAVEEGATRDGLDIESVPDHLQGVTCYFCHQVTEIAADHQSNNPLKIAGDTTMRGSIRGQVARSKAHRTEYAEHLDGSKLQESSRMCGTCHDIVLPKHFSGASEDVLLEQTYAEWKETQYATSGSAGLSCNRCHLVDQPNEEIAVGYPQRTRHEHRFPAVDTALTEFPDKDAQAKAVRHALDAAVRVELCVSQSLITVIVDNLGAGHSFPSGASHDRRVWAEVHGFRGQTEVSTSGVVPAGGTVANELKQGRPPMGWWDLARKQDGSPAHMFWDVATLERHSVPGARPGLPPNNRTAQSVTLPTGAFLDSVKVTLWVEPVGADVLDDLIATKHLNVAVKEAMPRHAVLPSRLVDDLTPDTAGTMEWRYEELHAYVDAGTLGYCKTVEPTR